MRRILLSIAILLFFITGTVGWFLYSLNEKTIEQIEESSTRGQPDGTTPIKTPDKPPVTAPSPTPSPAQSSNTSNSNTAQKGEDYKTEAVESTKDSLTELLLSKLTQNDISELQGMLSNGITAEEKRRAMEIINSRFSAEDIIRIKNAYIKYTQHN